MSRICSQCHKEITSDSTFCSHCGARIAPVHTPSRAPMPAPNRAQTPAPNRAPTPTPNRTPMPAPNRTPMPAPNRAPMPAPNRAQTPAPNRAQTPAPNRAQTPAPNRAQTPAPNRAPMPAPSRAPIQAPTAGSDKTASKKKPTKKAGSKGGKKSNKKLNKKKKTPKERLKACIVPTIIIGITAFLVFAFGNNITLRSRSDKDMEVFNTGSLEVPGSTYNKYSQLPTYAIKMLGGDPDEPQYGELMSLIIPHIKVERNSINGFFGGKTVEYTVYAPDMETWLLNLNPPEGYTQDDMLKDIAEYIPDAPLRSQVVTIEYSHDGLFDWQGNYMEPEFTNAISGGISTAYQELYAEIYVQLQEELK